MAALLVVIAWQLGDASEATLPPTHLERAGGLTVNVTVVVEMPAEATMTPEATSKPNKSKRDFCSATPQPGVTCRVPHPAPDTPPRTLHVYSWRA